MNLDEDIILEKAAAHMQAMESIEKWFPNVNPQGSFQKNFVEVFAKGIDDPTYYNRAIRRLCTMNSPKVASLLEDILKQQLILQISVTETNNNGMSALDYAEINNHTAYVVLKASITRAVADPAIRIAERGLGLPHSNTNTRSDQDRILDEAADEVFGGLQRDVLTPQNIAAYSQMGPIGRHQFCQAAALNLVEGLQPQIQQMQGRFPVQNLTGVNSSDSLEQTIAKINGTTEFADFLSFYHAGNFEQCLRWLAKCKDLKVNQVFEAFIHNVPKDSIDINLMLDAERRTPLHDAAINQNWGVYYAMIGHYNANSQLLDTHGVSAAQYRRNAFAEMNLNGQEFVNTLLSSVTGAPAAQGNAQQQVDPEKCSIM